MPRESTVGKVTGTWGGILTGVAAILTAVGLNITDTSDEQAKKADEKSELVLDLFRDRFNTAEADRLRLQKELEYQRAVNAKLFSMISDLRMERGELPTSEPEPVVPSRPSVSTRRSASGSGSGAMYAISDDPLAAAIEDLPEEDQFDLPEPPPAAPVAQKQPKALPQDLEDLLPKKK